MKRVTLFILILVLCLSLAACVNDDNKQENNGEIKIPEEPAELLPTKPETPIENEVTIMQIAINDNIFRAELFNNQTAKAFAAMLPIKMNMSELNNNEKYCYLQDSLPTAASSAGAIQAGDIMLWGNNCLVLFYKSFSTSYSYTKLGRIEDAAGFEVALGRGNITVTFSIEIK